jgi:hypothetical protein
MRMIMTVTPVENVKNRRIVDPKSVYSVDFDWDEEIPIHNSATDKDETILCKEISLFKHFLLIDGHPFKVTHALSKQV